MVASKLGLGINQQTEQEEEVTIGDIERRGGLLLRGNPRTGKTTLLVNLILQDIQHGHGLQFIDPHGDAIEDILKRLPCREEDVIFFDPFDEDYAFGLNLFEADKTNKRQVTRSIDYVLSLFAKLFTEKGDLAKEATTMDETMQYTGELLVDNQDILLDGKPLGVTMAEIPWIFNYEEARARLTPQLSFDHDNAAEFWRDYEHDKKDDRKQTVGSSKRRISKFLSNPYIRHILGQKTSTIDFRTIIHERKILLVKLAQDNVQFTKLIGTILISKLLNVIFSDTTPEEKRIDFAIYCDEFQNFASPDFAKLFTETGKWHIMPTVSHQAGAQLEHVIRQTIAPAAIKVLYQLTEDDADEFAPELAKKPTLAETRKEPILTSVTNPLEWFKSGKGHRNQRVNELVAKYLLLLFSSEKNIYYIENVLHAPTKFLACASTGKKYRTLKRCAKRYLFTWERFLISMT